MELLRISKQTYYQKIFEENKKDSREFGKVYMKLYLPERVKKKVVYQS